MLTEKNEQCWVCDRWIFTVLMWNNSIGLKTCVEMDKCQRDSII